MKKKKTTWQRFKADMKKTGRSPKQIKRSFKRKRLPKPNKDTFYVFG